MQLTRPYDYDRARFGRILDWDEYSFQINGRRVFLLSGEFHYWRVPDRERWRDVLTAYRAGGLNCVRIYFHWGFHSPNEDTYIFSGNRDLEYLFRLCEELGLYVLCAPGPYICAETTAGGYPPWLLAKTNVSIRHMRHPFVSRYDPVYAAYSRRWLAEFIPIMARHERTTNPEGCVIGLQIENEHIRKKVLQFGLDRHMEDLALAAREFGATTPLFHNDPWEQGSWTGGDDPDESALVDLYGFDRYIIWCPRRYDRMNPPRWKTKDFARAVAGAERRVRAFGGRARTSPIFLVELQGGWFNQWGHDHGFDEVYDFYGDEYTRTIVQSFMNEGSTMLSIYMYYGGTNWGALGDPDVYTSYDYGACIREFGYLSDRLRKLRLLAFFVRGFETWLTRTDAVKTDASADRPAVIAGERQGPDGARFLFLRNFDPGESPRFQIEYDGIPANVTLAPRAALVAPARLTVDGFRIELATLAWITRLGGESERIWVFQHGQGELILAGQVRSPDADDRVSLREETAEGILRTRVRFDGPGITRLYGADGASVKVLVLNEVDALTLAVDFEQGRLAWGAWGLWFGKGLAVETTETATVRLLGVASAPGFSPGDEGTLRRSFAGPVSNSQDRIILGNWRISPHHWNDLSWKPIDIDSGANPMNHGFHSGHTLYRCLFESAGGPVDLSLNARHRAMVWCNGARVGGQVTYGYSALTPGAKNGPDLTLLGSRSHSLPVAASGQTNELLILTESLGYNRGPFALNDFRNPRGILHTRLSGRAKNPRWMIAGVDVTARQEIFNTTGLPDEARALGDACEWTTLASPPGETPEALVWYRAEFEFKKLPDRRMPLQLHLNGPFCAHVFLNGLYMARYWGDFGPQHDFYCMDELVLDGVNTLVMAVYGTAPGPFLAEIRPYRINPRSGNLEENGPVFSTQKYHVDL